MCFDWYSNVLLHAAIWIPTLIQIYPENNFKSFFCVLEILTMRFALHESKFSGKNRLIERYSPLKNKNNQGMNGIHALKAITHYLCNVVCLLMKFKC